MWISTLPNLTGSMRVWTGFTTFRKSTIAIAWLHSWTFKYGLAEKLQHIANGDEELEELRRKMVECEKSVRILPIYLQQAALLRQRQ